MATSRDVYAWHDSSFPSFHDFFASHHFGLKSQYDTLPQKFFCWSSTGISSRCFQKCLCCAPFSYITHVTNAVFTSQIGLHRTCPNTGTTRNWILHYNDFRNSELWRVSFFYYSYLPRGVDLKIEMVRSKNLHKSADEVYFTLKLDTPVWPFIFRVQSNFRDFLFLFRIVFLCNNVVLF